MNKRRFVNKLKNKHFALFGLRMDWPSYFGHDGPVAHLRSRGALIDDAVGDTTHYLVLGTGREKGKAEAERQAQQRQGGRRQLTVLNEIEFLQLLRLDLSGHRFAFCGGFVMGAMTLADGPRALLDPLGCQVDETLTAELDFLVVGERRAAGKTAALRQVEALNAGGADIQLVDEAAFLDLVAHNSTTEQMDFPALVTQLRTVADPKRIDRAIQMLKKERFEIYADCGQRRVSGIIKSQSEAGRYYAPWITNDGSYSCHDAQVNPCMGLQGQICKHVVALLLGLVSKGELDAGQALDSVTAARKRRPSTDADASAEMLLRYRSVQTGELDWRPTETVPEDFYLL